MILRNSLRTATGVATILMATAIPATGQRCLGYPSLDVVPVAVSVTAGFAKDESTAFGTISGGRAGGLFGGLSAGVQSFDAFFASDAPVVAVHVGREIPVARQVTLCPVVGGLYEHGPRVAGLALRTAGLQAGLAAAWLFDPDDPGGFSGYLSLAATRARTRVVTPPGVSSSQTDGEVELGLVLPSATGYRFVPYVAFPMSGRRSASVLGLRLSIAMGGGPSR